MKLLPTRSRARMALLAIIFVPLLTAFECTSNADRALENVGKASEQFEVYRYTAFINVIHDTVIAEAVGFCSVEFKPNNYDIICKDENGTMMVNKLGRSDNVTMVVRQLKPVKASEYQYRFLIKPGTLIPDFDVVVPGALEGNS